MTNDARGEREPAQLVIHPGGRLNAQLLGGAQAMAAG